MIAAEQGHVDAVKYLLSLPGIDVNKQEQISQLTALHFAISHMYKDVVQILCEHGANVHLRIVVILIYFYFHLFY